MIALSVAKLKMFSTESEIFLWIKPKKENENFSVASLDQCRRLKVREKEMFFVMSLRLSDHMVLPNIASSSSVFDFARIFSLFSLVFRTSKFWSLRNLIKQLFHERALDINLLLTGREGPVIKFSTSNNAFRVLWLVHLVLIISSDTLVWPYMVNDCAKRC